MAAGLYLIVGRNQRRGGDFRTGDPGAGPSPVPERRYRMGWWGHRLSGPGAVRAAHVGLWAVVAIAAVSGLAALATRPPASGRSVWISPTTAGPEVGAFAEQFVAAYLSAGEGTEASLKRFLGTQPDLTGIRSFRLTARRTTVDRVEAAGTPGYWAVTVTADVVLDENSVDRPAGVRHYQVGVFEQGRSLVASDLPALVAGPPTAPQPTLTGPALASPRPNDPVAEAIARFGSALLAGEGEIGRYVAPGSGLRAITPPPFTTVRLLGLAASGTGPHRVARAELRGTTEQGTTELVHYWLRLTRRDGQWEIAALSGAPDLAASTAARPPAPALRSPLTAPVDLSPRDPSGQPTEPDPLPGTSSTISPTQGATVP
jgi:hypothetical protein